MRKIMILGTLLMSVALPVSAQTPQTPLPPEALRGVEGLKYQGQSGGVDYWFFDNAEDVDYIVGQNRADGSVSIGYLFDKNGTDISAGMTGFEPMKIQDFIPRTGPAQPEQPQVADANNVDAGLSPLAPQPGLEEDDNRLLENAPVDVRNALLAQLVEDLNKTKTRGEFEEVVLRWREHVRETLKSETPSPQIPEDILNMLKQSGTEIPGKEAVTPEKTSDDAPSKALSATDPVVPAQTDAASDVLNKESQNTPAVLPNPMSVLASEPAPSGEAFNVASALSAATEELSYETISKKSRWFALGAAGAPTAYVVIDPTCPYCARTLVELEPDVLSGKLQLRIVLAPLLSAKSEETIAGLMLSNAPGAALFDNAKAKAGVGGHAIQPRNATDLPEDVRHDLSVNRQNVIDLGVNQIPYFVWKTEEGVKTSTGVPNPGQFEGALSEKEPG